jgi:hypothetical protein
MTQAVFLQRMQAVLQRRFGASAATLAHQQWALFQQGVLAQQEDWLKQDCILATCDRIRAEATVPVAWQRTGQIWTAYAQAVQHGRLPASWWFPAAEFPAVLRQVTQQQGFFPHAEGVATMEEHTASDTR